MYRYTLFVFIGLLLATGIQAQSYWFGAKGGLAMNNQSWGSGGSNFSINRGPLFNINGDIFAETYDEDKKGALYAQLGFHTRGSSLRYISILSDFRSQVKYKFNNLVLELGAKKGFNLISGTNAYFLLGVRGEYTAGSNLGNLSQSGLGELVSPDYIRKLNYGVTFGGGFEREVTELSNVFLEFSVQPDLSFQYEQFPIDNIRNPWVPNERMDLPLTQVRNLSIEAKVGIKFLRKIIYLD